MKNKMVIPEKMKDPLLTNLTVEDVTYQIIYQPRAMLNKLLDWIEEIEYHKMEVLKPSDAIAVKKDKDLLSAIQPVPSEEAMQRYNDFIQVCLLFRYPEVMKDLITNAPRKSDGSLALKRVQRLATTGLSVYGKFIELCAINNSERSISIKIRRTATTTSNFAHYKDIPSSQEVLRKWDSFNRQNLDEGFVPIKKFSPSRSGLSEDLAVGDTFNFGKDNIRWKVIVREGDRALIISDRVPFQRPFDESNNSERSWETSSLRAWLNEEYLQQGFTIDEQHRILETKNINPGNEKKGLSGGNDTVDRIFILSDKEAADLLKPINAMDAGTFWWLRTVGESRQHFSFASTGSKQSLRRNGGVWYDRGVRPAMWISLTPTTEGKSEKNYEPEEPKKIEQPSKELKEGVGPVRVSVDNQWTIEVPIGYKFSKKHEREDGKYKLLVIPDGSNYHFENHYNPRVSFTTVGKANNHLDTDDLTQDSVLSLLYINCPFLSRSIGTVVSVVKRPQILVHYFDFLHTREASNFMVIVNVPGISYANQMVFGSKIKMADREKLVKEWASTIASIHEQTDPYVAKVDSEESVKEELPVEIANSSTNDISFASNLTLEETEEKNLEISRLAENEVNDYFEAVEEFRKARELAFANDDRHLTYHRSMVFLTLIGMKEKNALSKRRGISSYGVFNDDNLYGPSAEVLESLMMESILFLNNDLRLAFQIALSRTIPLKDRFRSSTYQFFLLLDVLPPAEAKQHAIFLTKLVYNEEELKLIPSLFDEALEPQIHYAKKYADVYPELHSFESIKPYLRVRTHNTELTELETLYFQVEKDASYSYIDFKPSGPSIKPLRVTNSWVNYWETSYVEMARVARKNTLEIEAHIRGSQAIAKRFVKAINGFSYDQSFIVNDKFKRRVFEQYSNYKTIPFKNQPEDLRVVHYTENRFEHVLTWDTFYPSIDRFIELNRERFSLIETLPQLSSLDQASSILAISIQDELAHRDMLSIGFNIGSSFIAFGFLRDPSDRNSFETLDIGWLYHWKCTPLELFTKTNTVIDFRGDLLLSKETLTEYNRSIHQYMSEANEFWENFEEHLMKRMEDKDYQWEGWSKLDNYLREAWQILQEMSDQNHIIKKNKRWFGEERVLRKQAQQRIKSLEKELASL